MLLIMEAITPLWLLLIPVAAALSWTACLWRYRRKLLKLEHRMSKLNADRDALQEQLRSARQQLGQLQKELSTVRTPGATPQPAHGGARPSGARPEPAVRMHPEISGGLVFEAPQSAAHGFADTMPFDGDTRA